MKHLRICFPFIAALALLAGCESVSTKDLGTMVEQGAIIAGEDPAEAQRIGQAASGVTGLFGSMDAQTERELGGGIAIKAFSEIGPLHPDRDLQRYVNLVGRAVARQSARPDLAYSFAVIENSEPNAFAAPGGYVFITTGALELMNNEAELAGVLAHEIAHITERHMLQTYRRSQLFTTAQQTAALFEDNVEEYSQMVDFGSDVLFHRGLDQRFEFEADLVGAELAALTGYDPSGLENFLRNLQSKTGSSGGWLKTHPSSAQRIARIEAIMPDLQNPDAATNGERFQQSAAGRLKATQTQTTASAPQ